ncbi:helix-turn-helix domain-containing protein [Tenacibaculum jejuense]|uniref:Regulatory helix-turn-helix protein, AraC family n=1 Tax=Tenacibaculum jejuense TaxID=584609 RepID=A0A238UED6_9FLAO|nr:helix-turn-helix domain-containing protein [Tenacibaculum jejuense]SNR17415.1 Regulatory helix-turn-helix protein, AraC family [Tenacibaculum jejuense]
MIILPAFTFPNFNLYSTPLLVLVLQALLFSVLLIVKYSKNKNVSYLILSIILLLVSYQQICYTVGFMGWYDTYRTTKINYWLMPVSLVVAPMIYFYVRSITQSNFKFKKSDIKHFLMMLSLILFRVCIYIYDAFQPGFHETQNGVLKVAIDEKIIQPILVFLDFAVMLLYLAFTFQLFYNYRKKINQFFSNTYKLELNWVLSFLIVFSILFLYGSIQTVIDVAFISLSYTQQWWLNLLMAVSMLYIGVRGFFTDTGKLNTVKFDFNVEEKEVNLPNEKKKVSEQEIQLIDEYMKVEKPYLNAELNLSDLASNLHMHRSQLSQIINQGFDKNFNDFINEFRVNAFKEELKKGSHKELSLLGIALDCGFNSKATFNRVFRKLTQTSPTEFIKQLSLE